MKIGVDIITGFLGEGKSTFINDYINYTKVDNERICVVCYESGNIKIKEFKSDLSLVKAKYINTERVNLNDVIDEIMKSVKPHRIIIEYNGTMNLIELYKELGKKQCRSQIKLYNIIFVSSGKNILSYIKNLGDFILPFIENSDVIVINQSKSIKKNDIDNLNDFIEKTNHKAHIFIENTNEELLKSMDVKKLIISKRNRKIKVKLINLRNKW